MLLTIDIGNTNIKFGVFDQDTIIANWRVATDRLRLADEYAVMVQSLFSLAGLDMKQISGCAISCVVPPLMSQFRRLSEEYIGVEPVIIGPKVNTGLRYSIDTPNELGADRVANSVAAYHMVNGPVIAVAFGTATAFDVIVEGGEYIGGAIAPGMGISADAMFRLAARLYQVELVPPPQVIGKNTVHYMQSGLLHGYAGLVEGLVSRMHAELGFECPVIATGGLAEVVAKDTKAITRVEPYLTLEGIRRIYAVNKPS